MNRHKKIQIIFTIAEELNLNKSTLVFLLAVMNDKALTKFLNDFEDRIIRDFTKTEENENN